MPDARTLRDNLMAFAEAIGTPLTDWQVNALCLETRITTIVAPRQSGKSRSLAVLALHWAYKTQGQRVLIISAGEDASRRLLSEIRAIVSASPMLRASAVDEQAGLLTLTNGSEIRSVPASERAIRGWSTDLLLCDECALIADDLLLGAGMPTTAARPNARIVLASSATSATGAFYDHAVMGEAGAEHTRTYKWALTDCTWISPTAIQAARDSMTSMRFAAEYEGVFASGQDALLSRHAIDGVLCDRMLWPLDALTGPARVMGGIDWGGVCDRSVLCAIGRIPGENIFTVVTAHRWLAGYPGHEVVKDIVASPALFALLTMEANGLGLPLCQLMVRDMRERPPEMGGGLPPGGLRIIDANDTYASPRKPKYKTPSNRPKAFSTYKRLYNANAASKAATYSALRLLIEQRRLLIPRAAEDLIRELLMLRVDLSPSGTEKIEATSGHDDMADALAMALGPHQLESGEWRTHLARIADKKAIHPATGFDESDPGVYQSVGGPEISGFTLPVPTAQPINVERHGPFTITR